MQGLWSSTVRLRNAEEKPLSEAKHLDVEMEVPAYKNFFTSSQSTFETFFSQQKHLIFWVL